jgi:hypothetical protein
MTGVAKFPCDQAVMLAGRSDSSCVGRGAWVLAATILGSSMAFIDGTVVNVALPALQADLHATIANVQWVVESYALLLAALLLHILDYWLPGSLPYPFLCGSFGMVRSCRQRGRLIAARSLVDSEAHSLVPNSLALIGGLIQGRARLGNEHGLDSSSRWRLARCSGMAGAAPVVRWAFFINLPIAIAVVALTAWRVPEDTVRRENWKLD